MVKKTLLSLAVATALTSMVGCNVSTTDKYDDKISNSGVQYTQGSSVYPIFAPEAKQLPLAIDLVFAEASKTDGTASADDTQPPVTTALNQLDGFAVAAPIDVEFSRKLDKSTLIANKTVFLVKLRNSADDASIDALDMDTILAVNPTNPFSPAPLAPNSYTVDYLELDGGATPTVRINLNEPLEDRTKYLVFFTDDIKGANGEAASMPVTFAHAAGDDKLMSDLLIPVRPIVKGWQDMANGVLAQHGAKSKPIFSYTFTTGGTTSLLKMVAAPEMYVTALAKKPDTAEKLYLGAQKGGYLANLGLTAPPTAEQVADAEAYAKTQWTTNIVTPVITANPSLAFADPTAPTDKELAALRANATYKTTITTAAQNPLVIGGITATLHTPKAQEYKAIPSVPGVFDGLTPAKIPAFADTPVAADTVTKYVQGSLTLPVGLSAPVKTNAAALGSGDLKLMADAIKLSMASDDLWSADPALNPPKDNKKFDPTTGKLVDADVDDEGNITDGMTNVTYRYPLVSLDKVEHAPVLVTLPGDYTTLGKADCTALEAGNGYPVIVFIHGITSDRTSSLLVGQSAAFNGCYATVAMDIPLHGVAPVASDRDGKPELNKAMAFNTENVTIEGLTPNPSDSAFVTAFSKAPYANANYLAGAGKVTVAERHHNIGTKNNARVDMVFGSTVETSLGKSGDTFINLANLGRLRDNMREAVVDYTHLLASLDNIATAHGVTFDTSKVYVAGHSLGAILATTLTTVVNDPAVQALNGTNIPAIKGVVLANPGASLPKMLENSPGFAPTVLGGLNLAQDSSSLQKYEAIAQAALNSVDPIGFAKELGAQANTPVLLFNAVGGGDCPNFVPFDADGNPTATPSAMVGAHCNGGNNERLPSGIALAFQGKYPADHVVPNFSYFADAATNPFAGPVMGGLSYMLGEGQEAVKTQITETPSAYSALVGTNPLVKLAGLTTWDGAAIDQNKNEIQFDQATHSTFAAGDDVGAFETMMTQMLTFFTTNGAALNPTVDAGVKKAE